MGRAGEQESKQNSLGRAGEQAERERKGKPKPRRQRKNSWGRAENSAVEGLRVRERDMHQG